MDLSAIRNDTVLGRALRAPLRLLPSGMRVPVLQGPLRGKSWLVGAHTHGCWLGSYEYDKQRLFAKHVRPGAIVYDVGANVGFYTMVASVLAGHAGRVLAFEPAPRNLLFLREHVRLNALDNVTILDLALAECPGIARFSSSRQGGAGHLSAAGDLEVRTSSLDVLVEARVAPPPNVIKMDIEGGELGALRGARELLERYRPTLFLATHGPQIRAECIRELRSLRYQLTSLTDSPVGESDEMLATRDD